VCTVENYKSAVGFCQDGRQAVFALEKLVTILLP